MHVQFLMISAMALLKGFNPFKSEWHCLNPEIIVNPKLPELIYKFCNVHIFNDIREYQLNPWDVHCFSIGLFHPDKIGVTMDNYQDCFVLDNSTGEIYPVYFVVPCGKCLLCSDLKCQNFSRRCQYETQLYDCDPIHITMTYDAAHLPKDKSVNIRHIQLWKKRFRKCLEDLHYGRTLRFAVAAEYGNKSTRRPHYHVLVWNLKPDWLFTYRFLKQVAYECWYDEGDISATPMCRYFLFTFDPINADYIPKGCTKSLREMGKSSFQAFGYVSKYFYKQDESSVPPGCKSLFHTMSKSSELGGIGAPFIDKHSKDIRAYMKKEYQFLERSGGTVEVLRYDRYVLNRVFPSKYTAVPYKVRKSLLDICRYGYFFPNLEYRFKPLLDKLSELYPILRLKRPSFFCFRGRQSCPLIRAGMIARIYNALFYLEEVVPALDIGEILKIDRQRSLFLSKLFANKDTVNVNVLHHRKLLYRQRRKELYTKL